MFGEGHGPGWDFPEPCPGLGVNTNKKEDMHMSEFVSAATPSGGINWADYKGSLLVIEPLSFETGIQTSFGPADATKANVYALTGPDTADEYPETLIFPKLLASQTKGQIGRKVVGRLGQGTAKPGQSAPWLLEEATADDLAKAKAYIDAKAGPVSAGAPSSDSGSRPPF